MPTKPAWIGLITIHYPKLSVKFLCITKTNLTLNFTGKKILVKIHFGSCGFSPHLFCIMRHTILFLINRVSWNQYLWNIPWSIVCIGWGCTSGLDHVCLSRHGCNKKEKWLSTGDLYDFWKSNCDKTYGKLFKTNYILFIFCF